MNKADRIALQQQAEKSVQRHREYIDKKRAQRADDRSAEQRSTRVREQRLAQLRDQANASRTSERQPPVKETRVPRAAPPPPSEENSRRSETRAKRMAAPRDLTRQRAQRETAQSRSRSEPRQKTAETPKPARNEAKRLRQSASEAPATLGRRTAERTSSQERESRRRASSEAARQLESSRRTADRKRSSEDQNRQSQIRAAAAAGRRSQAARQQQSTARTADRQVFHDVRVQRRQTSRKSSSLRQQQRSEAYSNAHLASNRTAASRRSEVARRTADRRAQTALPAAARSRATRRAAVAAAPPQYNEPSDSLSWLRAVDGFIVDENGNSIALRGINVEGLDSLAPAPGQTIAGALSLDDANLSSLSDLWGINLVRIPFQPTTILSGVGSLQANDLLSGLDDLIYALAQANIYTLIALRMPPLQGAATIPLPDSSVFDCWKLLSQHYEDEPAVLFEIYASATPIDGDWLSNAPILIGTIRQLHPASLLFVGNGSGAADTTGLPLLFTTGDPTPNLVYTIRVAPTAQPSLSDENLLSALTRSFPVFVSDWTGPEASDFDRGAEAAAALFIREGIGWAAGSWNAEPRLVRNSSSHDLVVTRWGAVVQRTMIMPVREPLTKLLPGETDGS